jgi:hypothetical protein
VSGEIALITGSYQAVLLIAPLMFVHRGRVYHLVETPRHGLLLEGSVSGWNENGLTSLTATPDTTRQ